MSKILIIEDEEAIADLEKDYLELTEDFNLVILDLMLPEMNGFDICREIRAQKNTPIIMVSAKKDDIDKIRGLGLSNFLPHHIKNILENGTVKPVVNQLNCIRVICSRQLCSIVKSMVFRCRHGARSEDGGFWKMD